MTFDAPRILLALPALVPLGLWSSARFRRRFPAFLRLGGVRGDGPSAEILPRRQFRSSVLFFAALGTAVIALAGPRWGSTLVPEFRRGVDVVLALDVSRSMDAADVLPTRLRRAASISRNFVENSPGLRFAVALGKGRGVLAIPLTDDIESIVGLLRTADSGSLTSGGTDLESLLDAAAEAFPHPSSARKLVVLLSDGEGLSGNVSAAAARAAADGIRIVAVGLGKEEGTELPVKDEAGVPVKSSLRTAVLTAAAERSGGAYVDGSRGDASTRLISYAMNLASMSSSDEFRRESVPQYGLFALLSAVLLLLSSIQRTLPRRRK